MTVSSTAARSGPYDGPGSTFDYTFYIGAASELLVTKTSTAGVDSTLTLEDSDYTVAIGADGTGTFTLATALIEDEKVTATLNLDVEQATDFSNVGRFNAETHEDALDYVVRICKMQQEQLDRCLKIAISSDTDATTLSYEDFLKRPALIDEQTVSNAATLDIGDINYGGWWSQYRFLMVTLFHVMPATDGDELYYILGGSGTWWQSANYEWGTLYESASSDTSVRCWPTTASVHQGNTVDEDAFGEFLIELADGAGSQGGRGVLGNLAWGSTSGDCRFSWIHSRYPTTDHVSAMRFWYNGGNIYGTAQLWGLPKN